MPEIFSNPQAMYNQENYGIRAMPKIGDMGVGRAKESLPSCPRPALVSREWTAMPLGVFCASFWCPAQLTPSTDSDDDGIFGNRPARMCFAG